MAEHMPKHRRCCRSCSTITLTSAFTGITIFFAGVGNLEKGMKTMLNIWEFVRNQTASGDDASHTGSSHTWSSLLKSPAMMVAVLAVGGAVVLVTVAAWYCLGPSKAQKPGRVVGEEGGVDRAGGLPSTDRKQRKRGSSFSVLRRRPWNLQVLVQGVDDTTEALALWISLRSFERRYPDSSAASVESAKAAFARMYLGGAPFDTWWGQGKEKVGQEEQPTTAEELWEVSYARLPKHTVEIVGEYGVAEEGGGEHRVTQVEIVPSMGYHVFAEVCHAAGFRDQLTGSEEETEIRAVLMMLTELPNDGPLCPKRAAHEPKRAYTSSPARIRLPSVSFAQFAAVWKWVGAGNLVGPALQKLAEDFVLKHPHMSFQPLLTDVEAAAWLDNDLLDQCRVPSPYVGVATPMDSLSWTGKNVFHASAIGQQSYVVRWSGVAGSFTLLAVRRTTPATDGGSSTTWARVRVTPEGGAGGAGGVESGGTQHGNYILMGIKDAAELFDGGGTRAELISGRQFRSARDAIASALRCMGFEGNEYENITSTAKHIKSADDGTVINADELPPTAGPLARASTPLFPLVDELSPEASDAARQLRA